jgi:hypothetical protein
LLNVRDVFGNLLGAREHRTMSQNARRDERVRVAEQREIGHSGRMAASRVKTMIVLAVIAAGCSSSSPSSSRVAPLVAPTASSPTAAGGPCTWLSIEDVRRIIGPNVEAGSSDPTIPLCTYAYTSKTGVSTDLVVGPWDQSAQSIGSFALPNHSHEVVADLGDHAVFLKAATIDDGNSVMVVVSRNRSLLLGGEFLNRDQAKRIAALVLAKWSRAGSA